MRSLLASATAGFTLHAVEGAAEFGIADHVGDAVGQEPDDRNDGERDDAGTNREPGENLGDEHREAGGAILGAAAPRRGNPRQQIGKWLRFGKNRRRASVIAGDERSERRKPRSGFPASTVRPEDA